MRIHEIPLNGLLGSKPKIRWSNGLKILVSCSRVRRGGRTHIRVTVYGFVISAPYRSKSLQGARVRQIQTLPRHAQERMLSRKRNPSEQFVFW